MLNIKFHKLQLYLIISNLLIVDRMVKIGESAADKTPYGELTQRLVAGLIEDNLMTAVKKVKIKENNDSGKLVTCCDHFLINRPFLVSLRSLNEKEPGKCDLQLSDKTLRRCGG